MSQQQTLSAPPILINEIMACPTTGQKEWIELKRVATATVPLSEPVSLDQYWFEDDKAVIWRGQGGLTPQDSTFVGFLPGQALLLIELSRHVLNNTGDTLSFFTPDSVLADQVSIPACTENGLSWTFHEGEWQATNPSPDQPNPTPLATATPSPSPSPHGNQTPTPSPTVPPSSTVQPSPSSSTGTQGTKPESTAQQSGQHNTTANDGQTSNGITTNQSSKTDQITNRTIQIPVTSKLTQQQRSVAQKNLNQSYLATLNEQNALDKNQKAASQSAQLTEQTLDAAGTTDVTKNEQGHGSIGDLQSSSLDSRNQGIKNALSYFDNTSATIAFTTMFIGVLLLCIASVLTIRYYHQLVPHDTLFQVIYELIPDRVKPYLQSIVRRQQPAPQPVPIE